MTSLTSPRRVVSDRTRAATRRVSAARPRRVSGPVGGRAQTAGGRAENAPGRAQSAPGRAQTARSRAEVAHARREGLPLSGRALALVRGLPDHSLIDRLVRGRAWIPVLGVLLAGIVAMQVEILKLGASMGRTMERSSTLQSQNDSLQTSVATLGDDQRIERLAAAMGMTMPTPDSMVFLSSSPNGNIGRAMSNIHAPDPVGFANQLAAQAAAAAALSPGVSSSNSSSSTTSMSGAAGTSGVATPTVTPSLGSQSVTAAATSPTSPSAPTSPATPAPTSSASTNGVATSYGAGAAPGSSSTGGGTAAGGTAAGGAAGVAPTGSSQSGGAGGG